MKCPKCSADIADGSPFCTSCGAQTGDQSAATVAISLLDLEDPLLKAVREELANEYYVERELGRGGMAIVYKGKEIGLERQVALKILPPEMAMMGGTADRFKREARLAAQMDHPNIIPIYRVGQSGNFHYMAMKFVEGRALDGILQAQGALPIPVAVRVLRDSASALAFAHDAGVIHRDIKGGNILIDRDGRVLVSDFGIARAAGEASLTASGMVVGTPSFMSPEQCGAGAVVPQSDQYSLGILGFQLLTGQLPFEADSLVEVIQHHYMTPPPDMREVRKEIPQELYDAVYKALSKSPDDRFATTHDMAEAFDAVPLAAEEKKEAIAMLKALSAGEKVGEVRTGSLPPVKIKTSAMGKVGSATAMAQAAPKKSRAGLVVGSLFGFAALGGAGYYLGVLQPQQQRAAAAAAAAAAQQVPDSTPGMVRFLGLPTNARVQIGDRVVGYTGGVTAPGTYTYRISAPGYRDTSGTVTVPAGDQVSLALQLTAAPRASSGGSQTSTQVAPPTVIERPVGTAELRLGTDPTTAEVLLDGNRLGAGRVLQQVSAGSHRLRVQLTGFVTFDTTINVVANEPVNLGRIKLNPAGGGQ
ncbi:MAG: protein kinase [Gemmatimonadetes bacterium]|nr:protein kinase [Gemmatimonadota bacterium]